MVFVKAGKETPADLYRMALDPAYWNTLEDLAEFPAAWPEFRQWVETAQQVGPELAGEPPQPPAHRRSLWPFKRQQSIQLDNAMVEVESGAGPDAVQTIELPVLQQADTENRGESVAVLEEIPRSSLRGILRGITKPVAVAMLGVVLAIGGYFVYVQAESSQTARTTQQVSDRRNGEATAMKKARADARSLLDQVAASPVAQDKALEAPTRNLNQALNSGNLTTLQDNQVQLEHIWNGLMSAKVKVTQQEMTDLLGQVNGLSDAPESENKKTMADLAAKWGQRKVTVKSLSDAMAEADRMHGLIDAVRADRDRAAQDRAEKEARSQSQAQVQPPAPAPVPQFTQPHRPQGNTNAPPANGGAGQGGRAPSWSVPAPSQDTGLPGHDGSL